MKRFLLSLVAPLLVLWFIFSLIVACAGITAVSESFAGGFGAGNNLTGFWQKNSAAAAPTSAFVGCVEDLSDLTTYSYVGAAIGTAHATRTVIVVIFSEDTSGAFNTSSVTIGGVSAEEQADTADATRASQASIYSLNVTSGSTATIAVTHSEAVISSTICVFAAYGLASATASDTAVATSSQTLNMNTDVVAGKFVVGGCGNGTSTAGPYTWVGLTERIDVTIASEFVYTAADLIPGASSTPLSISCASGSTTTNVGAVAAFQ